MSTEEWKRIWNAADAFDETTKLLYERAPAAHWFDVGATARDLIAAAVKAGDIEADSPLADIIAAFAAYGAVSVFHEVDRALGVERDDPCYDYPTTEAVLDRLGFYQQRGDGQPARTAAGWEAFRRAYEEVAEERSLYALAREKMRQEGENR